MIMENKTTESIGSTVQDKAFDNEREGISQKDLINYCNNAPTDHCHTGCPYIDEECAAYSAKYDGELPLNEDLYNPERYTDERLIINKKGQRT